MLHLKKIRLLLLLPLLLTACSSGSKGPKAPPSPKTTKVGGTVMIDGAPAPPGQVEMKLYLKGRDVKPGDVVPNCIVGKDGKFDFNSYKAGDGAVPGEYVLSMEWLTSAPGVLYGPDKLLNNFNSPLNEDPRFQVKVAEGQDVQIPPIDIKVAELQQQPDHPFASPAGKQK